MTTISKFTDEHQLNFYYWQGDTLLNNRKRICTCSIRLLSSRGPAITFTPALRLVAASLSSACCYPPVVSVFISGVTVLSGVELMIGVLIRLLSPFQLNEPATIVTKPFISIFPPGKEKVCHKK